MIVSLCPHCGQLAGDLSEVVRLKRELSKRLQVLLETLLMSEPDGISRTDLAVRMYGAAIGGSKAGIERLNTDMRELRRKLGRFGYFIPSLRPYRGNYRILPLEAAL